MAKIKVTHNLPGKVAQDELQKEVDAVGPGIGIACIWDGEALQEVRAEWDDSLGYDEKNIKDAIKKHKPAKSDFEKVREENQKPKAKDILADLVARVKALEAKK